MAPCQICGAIETDEAHAGRARHKNHVAIAPFVERGLVPLPYAIGKYTKSAGESFPSQLYETKAKSYASDKRNQSAWDSTGVLCCALDLAEDLASDLKRIPSRGNRVLRWQTGFSGLLAWSIDATRLCTEGVPWWHAWVRTSGLWPSAVEKILRTGVSDSYRSVFWEVVL